MMALTLSRKSQVLFLSAILIALSLPVFSKAASGDLSGMTIKMKHVKTRKTKVARHKNPPSQMTALKKQALRVPSPAAQPVIQKPLVVAQAEPLATKPVAVEPLKSKLEPRAPLAAVRAQGSLETTIETPWFSNYGGSVSYEAASNFAVDRDPRKYSHNWQIAGGLTVKKEINLQLGVDYRYYTLDNKMPNERGNPAIGDVFASADHHFTLDRRNKLTLATSLILPTSDESQFEGYQAITTGSVSLSTSIYKRIYLISNTLGGGIIYNTYDKSPTTLEYNPVAYGSYKFGNSIRLIDALKLGISFGAKVTRYIDDGNLLKFNNTESLSYAIKSWSFALSYTNGSYADMDKVDFFFLDEYRQLLTFSVGYDF